MTACQAGRPSLPVKKWLTNDPRLGKRHLEEHDLLSTAKVLDHTASAGEEGRADNPGAGREETTHDCADDPYFGQLPFDRNTSIGCFVIGNGNSRNIREDGQEAAHERVADKTLQTNTTRSTRIVSF